MKRKCGRCGLPMCLCGTEFCCDCEGFSDEEWSALAGAIPTAKVAYADPPYPGQSAKHYSGHPDYAGEVDHRELLRRIHFRYDGWLLHTSSTALPGLLQIAHEERITGFRIMAWVKPFAAFKRNVPVAYAWEPVLVKPCRKPTVSKRLTLRDWISEPITMKRGLSGAKPEAVCRWAFEVLGMEPADTLVDLFPGTGAVTAAWEAWRFDLWRGNAA